MHPRILHIYGPLWINGYGLMIALGFLLFTCLTYFHPWRKKLLTGDDFLRVLSVGFFSAVIGGRLLYVLFDPPTTFEQVKEAFYPWMGGFSLFGSIIAVLIAVPFFLHKNKIKILPFFDLMVMYAPLMQAVSRIGCFFAGCCYGVEASHEACWSVIFTDPESIAPIGIALHPTQLYSMVASFLIFLLLQMIAKRFSRYPGALLMLYLMLESMARFVVDFWRADRGELFGGVSMMQGVVLGLFLLAVIGLAIIGRKHVTRGVSPRR